MSFLNNCRQFTNLSAMKANFLQRINTVLPLVSDLVHAHVAMYTFSWFYQMQHCQSWRH